MKRLVFMDENYYPAKLSRVGKMTLIRLLHTIARRETFKPVSARERHNAWFGAGR
jgi:hypothetical protein